MSKKAKIKGKRDGTPEISGSPANEMSMEDETQSSGKKQVIIDEEILSLAIKNEDLNKLRETCSPFNNHDLSNINVMVRKARSTSGKENSRKLVTVAHPAPEDAPLKSSEFMGAAGPRFDESGIMLPHSILGSIQNYVEEATNTGELPTEIAKRQLTHVLPIKSASKYRSPKPPEHPKMESVHESNALRNWQVRMAERRRQQGYLSRLLGKPADSLVMNQADAYRQTQEVRHLIDKAIPSVDYGKGFRIGSEFWKQHEKLGDDIGGLSMMTGQAEKGYPTPVEYIGVPKTILKEKGSQSVRPPTGCRKPWHKTEYLHQRQSELQPLIIELGSYHPDLMDLEIVGTTNQPRHTPNILDIQAEYPTDDSQENGDEETPASDCLSCYPDVYPEPIFGPSIKFAGQSARWTGDSVQFKDQVGIEARITFEAYETRRTTSHLEVVNDGTTCIYYSWKKRPHKNPFDIVQAKVQRFYFDTNDGVILPGDAQKYPFVFKSPNAGVFMEQWEFQTRPTVFGGASLLVTLRGVALQEDKLKSVRSDIEAKLAKRQAVQIVKNVLHTVISGIRTPERPSSPVDAHITEEEIFHQMNYGLKYHRETIQDLQKLYLGLFSEEEQDEIPWDLNISSLKQYILAMAEEDGRKQEFLHKLNQAVANLSFPAFSPVQEQMYSVCYHMLSSAVDRMVEGCQKTQAILGIPDPQEAENIESNESSLTKKTSNLKSTKPETKEKETKEKKGSKKDEKLAPKTPSKESSPKPGKTTPAALKRPESNSKTSPSDERIPSPGQESVPSPTRAPNIDAVLQAKYRDKLYVHIYGVLTECLDQVGEAFAEIGSKTGGSPLASYSNLNK